MHKKNDCVDIVVDQEIAYAEYFFSPYGQLKLLPHTHIKNDVLKDTNVLIIRTLTKVNKKLLDNTSIKLVITATAGVDHLDIAYLNSHNIAYASASGSNASAVVDYVMISMLQLNTIDFWRTKTVGIIGCGAVGHRLFKVLQGLSVNCRIYDPPLKKKLNNTGKILKLKPYLYDNLNQVLASDLVTLHVPLLCKGTDSTLHLIDENNIHYLPNDGVLINSSRGAVVNNQALLSYMETHSKFRVVLDVWEHEPYLNIALLKKVAYASCHIAGYSVLGKITATKMAAKQLAVFLQKPYIEKELKDRKAEEQYIEKFMSVDGNNAEISNICKYIYDVESMTEEMRKRAGDAQAFLQMRKGYTLRTEFSQLMIANFSQLNRLTQSLLIQLGVKLDNQG